MERTQHEARAGSRLRQPALRSLGEQGPAKRAVSMGVEAGLAEHKGRARPLGQQRS